MTRRTPTIWAVIAFVLPGGFFFDRASADDVPGDQVLALYFHRTERCPTCLTMGRYAEEAVHSAFAERVKEGTVRFHYVDFQDPKNERLAKGYDIHGPALIVARISNKKVQHFSKLADIWAKVSDKGAFLRYVQEAVVACDAPPDRVVAMYFHRTERCPTCQKMGSYAEEAVRSGFAKEMKAGAVGFYYVDFQDPKNATLVKRYDVGEPALIVAKIKAKKAADHQRLEEIWAKVGDKTAFLSYVQRSVTQYRDHLQKMANK